MELGGRPAGPGEAEPHIGSASGLSRSGRHLTWPLMGASTGPGAAVHEQALVEAMAPALVLVLVLVMADARGH